MRVIWHKWYRQTKGRWGRVHGEHCELLSVLRVSFKLFVCHALTNLSLPQIQLSYKLRCGQHSSGTWGTELEFSVFELSSHIPRNLLGLYSKYSKYSMFSFIYKYKVDLDFIRLLADQQFCIRILHHIRVRLESPSIRQFKYNQPLEQMRIQANVYLLYLYLCLILFSLALSSPRCIPFAAQFNAHIERTPAFCVPSWFPLSVLSVRKILRIRSATPLLPRPYSHVYHTIRQFSFK